MTSPSSWTLRATSSGPLIAVRIALSGSDWPNSWPTPYAARLSRGARGPPLLPATTAREAEPAVALGPPVLPRGRYPQLSEPTVWAITRDVASGDVTFQMSASDSARPGPGRVHRQERMAKATANDATPAIASCESKARHVMELPGQTIAATAWSLVTSTESAFHLTIDLEVTVNGRRHFTRNFRGSYARDLL